MDVNKKRTDGRNEWMGAEEEKELSKVSNYCSDVRTQSSVKHKLRFIIDETNLRKQSKESKVLRKELGKYQVVHKQVRTSGPAAHDLPEGWVAHVDKNSGKQYYHNPKTGQTQWKNQRRR